MVFVEVNIEVRKAKIDNRESVTMEHKRMRCASSQRKSSDV